jgi:hypothetical protein
MLLEEIVEMAHLNKTELLGSVFYTHQLRF